MKLKLSYFFLFIATSLHAQQIKSIQLRPLQEKVFTSIVPLGTVLELSFDDLDADSKSYQYKIEHIHYNLALVGGEDSILINKIFYIDH